MSNFKKLLVECGSNSHSVHIGAGAVAHIGKWLLDQPSKRAFILVDQKLRAPREMLITALQRSGWEISEISVHAGEQLKDFHSIYPLYDRLVRGKADRDSVLFALGGGTIGDAAGFIASTYLRGIPWVGVPTTLLAQVDSSVGGKTGINHLKGKNLIGTFHQPSLVICDTAFLNTLGPRDILSGFGEMIKYGLIFDPKFFQFLKKNSDQILNLEPAVLSLAIQKCLQWKAKIVRKDALDRTGIREALNFGHTFGHALESKTQYRRFQHGEAVIWGMRFALALSHVKKILPSPIREEVDFFLSQLHVPPLPENIIFPEFFKSMTQDKKAREGKIHFVLLKNLGQAVSLSGITYKDLQSAYKLLILGSQF